MQVNKNKFERNLFFNIIYAGDFVSKPVADDLKRPYFGRSDMFACTVRALGRGFYSLSRWRSSREVSAHSSIENEKNTHLFSDNGFPEVNIATKISKDKARMLRD